MPGVSAVSAASVAVLTAGALVLAAPAAHATVAGDNDNNITSFGFSVTPSTVAAGGQVTLKVDGCKAAAHATSGVFDPVTIRKHQTATATVDWDAKPGAMYTVTFECKGETGTTDLTIAKGGGHHTGGNQTGGNQTGGRQHNVQRGVNAGIGGTFGKLDFSELALGAALITGALGSAYYWARRRPSEDAAGGPGTDA
ncbi:hypothetical protein QIS99_23835 [Streptomyces sp. B-S-A8]|uniref:Lipoprotein n=1 Tax=Streptomyces solicavernae TaxID=3043614 RepID=A0ABT6RXP5_9ACTN|nr:hypothetical protein [Streptomyces sp. B-S-A8]MDI3389204.1 hypothetical protein [Streptomyces sp. B-S-A8]